MLRLGSSSSLLEDESGGETIAPVGIADSGVTGGGDWRRLVESGEVVALRESATRGPLRLVLCDTGYSGSLVIEGDLRCLVR